MALAVPAYTAGARAAFSKRYADDVARVQALVHPGSRWIDSHCHLESITDRTWKGGMRPLVMENEEPMDLTSLVASWPPGLDGCICNIVFQGLSESWGKRTEWEWLHEHLPILVPDHPVGSKIWFTIGLHPSNATRWTESTESTVRGLLNHPRCVGIGECGLDCSFHHKGDEMEKQVRAFRAQAMLAVETGKALVVHARKAEDLCFQVLSEIVPPYHPVHMHCYTDSLQHALDLCDVWENLRIGFTGCVTFSLEEKGKGKGKGKEKGAKGRGKTKMNPNDRPEHFTALLEGSVPCTLKLYEARVM